MNGLTMLAVLAATQVAAPAPEPGATAAPPPASAPAPAPGDAAPKPVSAFSPGAHARMLESYAAPDIRRSAPTAITAVNAAQLKAPEFLTVANKLGERLAGLGFHMVRTGEAFQTAVVLQYTVDRDVYGTLPGQSTDRPDIIKYLGPAAFPAYRRLNVTAYDLRDRAHVKVLWRTVIDEDGFDWDEARTIPPLVDVGARYYGRSVTALAVADCDGFTAPVGSHIAAVPCGPVRARMMDPGVRRRPQVTVGPLSSPSTAAPAATATQPGPAPSPR